MSDSGEHMEYGEDEWHKILDQYAQNPFHVNEEAQKAVSGLLSLNAQTNDRRPMSPMRKDGFPSSPQRTITVAAPIPISYAVKNRSALRYMLSLGEEDQESNSETLFDSTIAQKINVEQASSIIAKPAKSDSKITFRTISPGTLIALADPCILSRCSEIAPSPIEYPLPAIFQHNRSISALPEPFPPAPAGLDMILSLIERSEDWILPAASQNMWGY